MQKYALPFTEHHFFPESMVQDTGQWDTGCGMQ